MNVALNPCLVPLLILNRAHSIQYQATVNKLNHAVKALERSRASLSIKLKVLQLVTYNQIIYGTKFATWPLHLYHKLDDIFTKIVKSMTQNMRSYRTALIYTEKEDMGLGIKQLSTAIQEA